MAKKGGGISQKRKPNWFDNQRRIFGFCFLEKVKANDILRAVPQIFSDIAKQNFDINDAMCFLNPQFLFQCLLGADFKRTYYSALTNGMHVLLSSVPTPYKSYYDVLTEVSRSYSVYDIIYNNLRIMYDNLPFYQANRDVTPIHVIANQIRKFRENLKRYDVVVPEMDLTSRYYDFTHPNFEEAFKHDQGNGDQTS